MEDKDRTEELHGEDDDVEAHKKWGKGAHDDGASEESSDGDDFELHKKWGKG
jgi:hypothetical protein